MRSSRWLAALGLIVTALGACEYRPQPGELEKPTGAVLPAAPPLRPQLSRPSVVLLRAQGTRLFPLYCYDDAKHQLLPGFACAHLLPPAGVPLPVRLSGMLALKAWSAAPLPCQTQLGLQTYPSWSFVPPQGPSAPGELPTFALWSAGEYPRILMAPYPPEPSPQPESSQRTINDAARNLLPKRSPVVALPVLDVVLHNSWLVDLDNDGLRERLDELRVVDGTRKVSLLAGVFVTPGLSALAVLPLRVERDTAQSARLVSAQDLDHDGQSELWLQLPSAVGPRDMIGSYNRGGLAALTEVACPSQ